MKKYIIEIIVGLLLLALGVGLWQYRLHNEVANVSPNAPGTVAKAQAPAQSTISGEPVHLSIPSLNMSLPIIDGYYNQTSKTWTLTLDKVQYATVTTPPNNAGGLTFLYGHYRPEVFAYLHLIHIGAQAIVTTSNNHTFTYQLDHIVVTNPADNSVFHYQGPPILTIQTCTGPLFENRQLFTFKLISVS